jgi:competence protein ComEA
MNRIKKLLKTAVLVAMLIICAGCSDTGITVTKQQDTSIEVRPSETDEKGSEEPDTAGAEETVEELHEICVFICGAVREEGVYYVPAGSRVNDVLVAAGGFSENASTSAVNLAELVSDGDRIYIPEEGEEITAAMTEAKEELSEGLVNINTAGKEELMTLPGIGETRAEEIISYREQQGGFAQVEDLMKVNGIKEGTFNKLKDKVTK